MDSVTLSIKMDIMEKNGYPFLIVIFNIRDPTADIIKGIRWQEHGNLPHFGCLFPNEFHTVCLGSVNGSFTWSLNHFTGFSEQVSLHF